MEETLLQLRGLPVIVRIDSAVWQAMGRPPYVECILEPIALVAEAIAGWITMKEAAAELAKDIGMDPNGREAYNRVSNELRSRNCHIRDNGKTGKERRLDRVSFDAWRLKQRDKAMAKDGWGDEGGEA